MKFMGSFFIGLSFLTIGLNFASAASAASGFVASGRAKVFKGPEGEVITMIPVEKNTKLLIHAHNTYGMDAEKTLIYDSSGDVANPWASYPTPKKKKVDGAPETGRMLVFSFEFPKEQWVYSDMIDARHVMRIKLTYSEELSAKVDTKKLLNQAVNFVPPAE